MKNTGNLQKKSNLELAIEGGLSEGSVAIRSAGKYIGGFLLDGERVQSEILLKSIDRIFKSNNLEKKAVNRIVCAAEVGSATGNRVAASVAFGLQTAFGCQIDFASVLENALHHLAGEILPGREIVVCAASRHRFFAQTLKRTMLENSFAFSPVVGEDVFFQWLKSIDDKLSGGSEQSEEKRLFEDIRDIENIEKVIYLNDFKKFAELVNRYKFVEIQPSEHIPAFYLGDNFVTD